MPTRPTATTRSFSSYLGDGRKLVTLGKMRFLPGSVKYFPSQLSSIWGFKRERGFLEEGSEHEGFRVPSLGSRKTEETLGWGSGG